MKTPTEDPHDFIRNLRDNGYDLPLTLGFEPNAETLPPRRPRRSSSDEDVHPQDPKQIEARLTAELVQLVREFVANLPEDLRDGYAGECRRFVQETLSVFQSRFGANLPSRDLLAGCRIFLSQVVDSPYFKATGRLPLGQVNSTIDQMEQAQVNFWRKN